MRAGVIFCDKMSALETGGGSKWSVGAFRCWKRYVCSSLQRAIAWLTRLLKSG